MQITIIQFWYFTYPTQGEQCSNTGKRWHKKLPFSDTFQAVHASKIILQNTIYLSQLIWNVTNLIIFINFAWFKLYSECGKIRTRKNSIFGHFSCSVWVTITNKLLILQHEKAFEIPIGDQHPFYKTTVILK